MTCSGNHRFLRCLFHNCHRNFLPCSGIFAENGDPNVGTFPNRYYVGSLYLPVQICKPVSKEKMYLITYFPFFVFISTFTISPCFVKTVILEFGLEFSFHRGHFLFVFQSYVGIH